MLKEKILIVTPMPLLGLGLQLQFQTWGFASPHLAASCQQVLAEGLQPLPALVLLDTTLPAGEDCFVLARLLQAEDGAIPILFLDQTLWEGRLGKPGRWMPYPHGWLPKPCHPEALLLLVKSLLPSLAGALS